jgi:hypothetical protein
LHGCRQKLVITAERIEDGAMALQRKSSMASQLKTLLHVHASLSAAAAEASSAHTEIGRLSHGLR